MNVPMLIRWTHRPGEKWLVVTDEAGRVLHRIPVEWHDRVLAITVGWHLTKGQ